MIYDWTQAKRSPKNGKKSSVASWKQLFLPNGCQHSVLGGWTTILRPATNSKSAFWNLSATSSNSCTGGSARGPLGVGEKTEKIARKLGHFRHPVWFYYNTHQPWH